MPIDRLMPGGPPFPKGRRVGIAGEEGVIMAKSVSEDRFPLRGAFPPLLIESHEGQGPSRNGAARFI